MTLGRGVNGTSYDGFGLSTTGYSFFNVTEKFWVQSVGDLVTQSIDNNIYSLAKGNNNVAAGGTATLTGGGGAFIAAGFGTDPASADASSPPDTTAADDVVTSIGKASLAFSILDTTIAFGCGLRAFVGFVNDVKEGTYTNKAGLGVLNFVGAMGGFAGGMINTIGMASQGAVSAAGVGIFGLGGVLVGTPAFGSVYAMSGLVLASLFPFIFGLDGEMFGLKSSTVTGYRLATLQSHSRTMVHSDGDVTISATGGGGGGFTVGPWAPGWRAALAAKLNVVGAALKVGTTKQGVVRMKATDLIQIGNVPPVDPTTNAIVAQAKDVTLNAGDAGQTADIIMNRNGTTSVVATSKVAISVGNFAVEVSPNQISIQSAPLPPAGPVVPPGPRVVLTPTRAVVQHGQNAIVKLEATGVKVQYGMAQVLEVSGTGVKVNGSRVQVG
jgi:hypothetical protein